MKNTINDNETEWKRKRDSFITEIKNNLTTPEAANLKEILDEINNEYGMNVAETCIEQLCEQIHDGLTIEPFCVLRKVRNEYLASTINNMEHYDSVCYNS